MKCPECKGKFILIERFKLATTSNQKIACYRYKNTFEKDSDFKMGLILNISTIIIFIIY